MRTDINELLASREVSLRDFGLTFARLIAALAVDPHGYFEKKYIARIEGSQSDYEIGGVLAQLVQWAVSSAVTDAQRERLDHDLSAQGLPSVADLRVSLLP
ncbi:MAG: hypothetical protein V2J12_09810 [Gammaproteobacteria bacterium]|jgi:hypothetical protein|nr:hypothetical protein [Gammaproteobacteria bacterium]